MTQQKTLNTPLFDRIRLQSVLRCILQDHGTEQGLNIIELAIKKELENENNGVLGPRHSRIRVLNNKSQR